MKNNKNIQLSSKKLKEMCQLELVLDATRGGFVIGNSHNDLGVKMIRQISTEEIEIIGELEGWEYVMSQKATNKFFTELKQMNEEFVKTKEEFIEYLIPVFLDLLDAKPIKVNDKKTGKLLLFGNERQFIINKFSTRKFLVELDKMNKEA